MIDETYLLVILTAAFLFIIITTTKFKVHPFIVLLITAFGTGIASGMPADEVISIIGSGFGKTLGSIGIIIIFGTTIGVFLQRSGAALKIAQFTLGLVGENRVPLSVSIFGYVVSIPIFCDSGFVILSPLNKTLAKQAKISMAVMAVILASALYATHCLVPPHPGPTAAVSFLSESLGSSAQTGLLGQMVLLGLLVAIPGVISGYLWAVLFAKRYYVEPNLNEDSKEVKLLDKDLPSIWKSFLPILLPVLLIGLRSFSLLPSSISFIGLPVVALFFGVVSAFFLVPKWNKEIFNGWIGDGIKDAGVILAITAAGGAFGSILRETNISTYLGTTLSTWELGLFLPFLLAAAIKTAQGSSTVAIITTAPLVAEALPELGLATGYGPVLALLAMGAGSMVVSHANDSFFWVVTKFSNLSVNVAYKVFTTATLIIGLVIMAAIYLLSLVLL